MHIRVIAWAIAGLLILMLLGWVLLMEKDLEAARLSEARLKADYAETLASLAAIQADHTRTVAALETVNSAEKARAETLTQAIKEIDDAPQTDDGPVAPVLRRALDGLRD